MGRNTELGIEWGRVREGLSLAEQIERLRCIALSLIDGEEASGDAGDYFAIKDENEPLTWEGEPMVLVLRSCGHVDALTGEAI